MRFHVPLSLVEISTVASPSSTLRDSVSLSTGGIEGVDIDAVIPVKMLRSSPSNRPRMFAVEPLSRLARMLLTIALDVCWKRRAGTSASGIVVGIGTRPSETVIRTEVEGCCS
jgi:hypothetical protein